MVLIFECLGSKINLVNFESISFFLCSFRIVDLIWICYFSLLLDHNPHQMVLTFSVVLGMARLYATLYACDFW